MPGSLSGGWFEEFEKEDSQECLPAGVIYFA
jgi:hypothetical protein